MIGTGMALGIGTAVAANSCMASVAGVLLEAFHQERLPARTPRSCSRRLEASENSASVLRIARAPALA